MLGGFCLFVCRFCLWLYSDPDIYITIYRSMIFNLALLLCMITVPTRVRVEGFSDPNSRCTNTFASAFFYNRYHCIYLCEPECSQHAHLKTYILSVYIQLVFHRGIGHFVWKYPCELDSSVEQREESNHSSPLLLRRCSSIHSL